MHPFETGRKIYAYDLSYRKSHILYSIDIDKPKSLTTIPEYIDDINVDGNFVSVTDGDKILLWNANNGKFIRTIQIPHHYDVRNERTEKSKFCYKGHRGFIFDENKIMIFHHPRNFPIAADLMLFW